jgi:uridine kinase
MAVSSKKSSKIFVIFCGGSGSGKTTLVDMVEKSLTEKYNVITLSLDDYYLVNRKSRNFDTPAAFD